METALSLTGINLGIRLWHATAEPPFKTKTKAEKHRALLPCGDFDVKLRSCMVVRHNSSSEMEGWGGDNLAASHSRKTALQCTIQKVKST